MVREAMIMNVLVFASRKGGTGKSTLAAHLAAQAAKPGRKPLLIDADPQGSLSLWHGLRDGDDLDLKAGRGLASTLKAAAAEGCDWVFIDTPPNVSQPVIEAIKAATMVVIPARPSLFDLAAVEDTIAMCKTARRPFAVVLNGAPARRGNQDSALISGIREQLGDKGVPVWSGQITHRTAMSTCLDDGEAMREAGGETAAAQEIAALWTAIQKSVKAIHGAYGGRGMHRAA
jgi:chromosome partitioning protein